ncbi:MAG TPA: hypothetical protein VIU61_20435 [Kofleriaceae bacterium]
MLRSLLVIAVLGCGGKQAAAPQPISNAAAEPAEPPPPPKTRSELALEKMGEFRDSMCKCGEGDKDCAQKVSDEMTKWSEAQPREPDPEPMKPGDSTAAEQIGKEMGECMMKAMMPPDSKTP